MPRLCINYTLHDPGLTEEGLAQCDKLAQFLQTSVPLAQQIDLIVVSPQQRTLQTADRALGWLRARGVPVIALAELQETTVNRCDMGSPVSALLKSYSWVDWSHLDSVWPAKEGLYEFSEAALIRRGREVKRWLERRPEKVIAVVSHANLLRTVICNRKFDNADFRVFEFETGGETYEDGPKMVESELTAHHGGGMGGSLDGFFGWEPNDFKYMPENNPEVKAELAATGHGSEV